MMGGGRMLHGGDVGRVMLTWRWRDERGERPGGDSQERDKKGEGKRRTGWKGSWQQHKDMLQRMDKTVHRIPGPLHVANLMHMEDTRVEHTSHTLVPTPHMEDIRTVRTSNTLYLTPLKHTPCHMPTIRATNIPRACSTREAHPTPHNTTLHPCWNHILPGRTQTWPYS